MRISTSKNKDNDGFTLIELVVVIAGLAALASFSIPNFLNSMKLNKIEEAKAIMNAYASDCLGKYRISTDPADFIENAVPDQIDNMRLSTLSYQIDGDKNKCSHVAIKPLNDKEKDIFAFDFRMSSDGKILKTATPSDNPRFLNSCRGWAGKNCGLSEAQKAEFARLAALAKAESECISNYNQWLADGSTGENVGWDKNKETCTRAVFAFEGIPVNSLEAIEKALEAKYGRACDDWRISRRNSISPNGNPETKDPECGGMQYWFHSGNEFTTQADWTEYDNKIKEQACTKDRSDALSQKKSGKYTYGPTPGPDPCGKTVWLCDGAEYNSEADYKTTSCGAPPPPPPPPPSVVLPSHCRDHTPHIFCGTKLDMSHPFCKCS
jgi:prepilin-type N-terminal cleavage/methylation domain-containing protein